MSKIDSTITPPETEVKFARNLGLFDATMIGIGAMIGAGIFVLTGIAAGEAGPGALLAFALNGLVTLLTALAYAELASVHPKSGGGYAFITKAFPGPVGFASGWKFWFCYIIACALYALGFGSYFWEFVQRYFSPITNLAFSLAGHEIPTLAMTALVCILFILVNMRGTAVTGSVENIITWIQKTIRLTNFEGKAHMRLIEGNKVATSLILAAAEYDMIALGASKEGVFSNVLFGEIPEKIARYSHTPVMIVQRYEGPVKSLVKRVLG